MDNIFNEAAVAKNILGNGFKGNGTKYEMILVSKHFRWIEGNSKIKTRDKLIEFCIKNDKEFNLITNSKLIKDVINIADRDSFKKTNPVQITELEIKKIKSIKNFQYQKILFVTLVFAKALKFTFSSSRKKKSKKTHLGYYISNKHFTKIKKITKTKGSIKDFIYIYHEFYKAELVDPTYFNSERILFSEDESIPVLEISDFNNILDYYLDYCGGELFYCEDCEKECVVEKRRKKRCKKCREKRRRKKTRNYVAKHRNSNK